jgi:Fe2+ transport system protein B
MSTAEWFGLFIFLIIVSLLFFAAFGGSNITEQSVDEYIKRLLGENREGDNK